MGSDTTAPSFSPPLRANAVRPDIPTIMKTIFLIPAVLLVVATSLVQAQPTGGPPGDGGPGQGGPNGGRRRPPPDPVLIALDANHDGVLSADEIANASKSLLALDKNGDGQLTQDELRPPRPADAPDGPPPPDGPAQGNRPPRPPSPVMHVLDANHDGVLSADEIANASKALLTLDKNGDGQLTPDELRPPRPAGDQKGPPPPPQG